MLVPARASALAAAAPGLDKGALGDSGVVLVRRGGFRGGGFRGGAFRGHGFRGGRVYGGWRGGRRYGWRRPGWGWAAGAAALAAAPYSYRGYRYGNCPLVRRTVWTPRGHRVRWARRCW
jgi:hypothetical protein